MLEKSLELQSFYPRHQPRTFSQQAATGLFCILFCCWTVYNVISRKESIEFIQHMETDLSCTFVILAPFLPAVITQTTGTTICLEVGKLLINRFWMQNRLLSSANLWTIWTEWRRQWVSSFWIPAWGGRGIETPKFMPPGRMPRFFLQQCKSIRSIEGIGSLNKNNSMNV